jgi:Skp family chaperone for outer membrane proteins
MSHRRLVLSLIALAAATAAPMAANSQTAAPSGLTGGPAIPNVCMLSREAVATNAKVGQAAIARLQQLAQQNQAPLATEAQAIDTEAKSLALQKASLSAATFQQRQQALSQRYQALRARGENLNRQLEATRVKALTTIGQDEQPVLAQIYTAHGCGMLLDRNVVIAGNYTNDLTKEVVDGMDARVTTITFELAPLPPAAGAGATAAPVGQ